MLIKQAPDIRSSEITPEHVYYNRRQFIGASGAALGAAGAALLGGSGGVQAAPQEDIPNLAPSPFSTDERLNSFEEITSYNNFYEFGLDKEDPKRYAHELTVEPWSVRVEGHINRPAADYTLEDILQPHPLEERIYRLRCVEAWSMAIPWTGFPMKALIDAVEPQSGATHVKFNTFINPDQAPGQFDNPQWPWPYQEGLRIDEAMNELTFVATGIYGHELPKQHGAPVRLVIPWKYGFKSAKSIVSIEFVAEQPPTFWNELVPREYGFLANVEPQVPHPRWSQATEKFITTDASKPLVLPTLLYNGYKDFVQDLYA